MSIKRMLMLASMALAAIGFGVPAAAQGNVELTVDGKVLPVNSPVTATSTNLITTAGVATLECKEVVLHYRVQSNTNKGKHVVLVPTEAHNATVEDCVSNVHEIGFGTQFNEITNAGAGALTIGTEGTGDATATFTSNTPALGSHCSYHGDIPVQATNGTDVLHVETDNILHDTDEVCADGEMHGDFTVTSNDKPVIIHFNDE